MEQLEEPASEILEAEHGELSKPPTDAALEGADFATWVPSGKPPTGVCKRTERPEYQNGH